MNDSKSYRQSLNRLYTADPSDISCDEASILMARLIEMGDAPLSTFPQLQKHLEACVDCREEFAMLKALAEMERQSVDETAKIPARPDQAGWLTRLSQAVKHAVEFGGFEANAAGALRGGGLGLETSEISFPNGVLIEIDPAVDATDSSRRSLFLSVQTDDADDLDDVEGGTAFLVPTVERGTVYTAMFDQYGDAALNGISPLGSYTLHVELGEHVIRIDNIHFD